MTSTQLILLLLCAYFLIYSVVWLFFLRLGIYWAKISKATWRRVFAATFLCLALPVLFVFMLTLPANLAVLRYAMASRMLAHILIPCWVIMALFKLRFMKAMQVWIPTVIPTALVTAAWVLIGPLFFEGFRASSNAMAPTILGEHWEARCEKCGGPCYTTPNDFLRASLPWMICEQFHVTQPPGHGEQVHPADHFLVAKFYEPRRADLVVFEAADRRIGKTVMRVVGLPGEEIILRDGRVYADGKPVTLPDSLNGIEYTSTTGDGHPVDWGTPDAPAWLGDDEYFLLGDFSRQANDSRVWYQELSGHPAYAVPRSRIHGVVINIYWPRSRWRAFR